MPYRRRKIALMEIIFRFRAERIQKPYRVFPNRPRMRPPRFFVDLLLKILDGGETSLGGGVEVEIEWYIR